MSVTEKTLKYRKELKRIDCEYEQLLTYKSVYTSDAREEYYQKLFKRLRKMIKGPFDLKEYQKAYHLKNRDKILKQQARYRRMK